MALTSGQQSGLPGLSLVAYGAFSQTTALAGNFGMNASVTGGDTLVITLNPAITGSYVVYAESMGGTTNAEVTSKTANGFSVKFLKADGVSYQAFGSAPFIDSVIQVYK